MDHNVPRNGPPTENLKMKYLTAPYLTLMHAFHAHADDVLSNQKYEQDRIANMQEYCTLRLDAGRQTGKTEAVALFAADWIDEGGTVICLAYNSSYAKATEDRIRIKCMHKYVKINPLQIFSHSMRSFLSDSGDRPYRGTSLSRVLVIIDEPCSKMPEIYKFYKAYEDNVKLATRTSGAKYPLFFVMGIQ
ncbi:hypothetical protein AU156_gp124 [Edwardsiella phage PEi20]|uniref:Uncharacterized protein n=1 Tax=Edwardsiella phage PEi20 TaxID=1608310 RepID=A0A0B6VR28_9CAUD|nr:hypothetical protein AU156_gp124 [Edwardsiella phage PEi20]BAQ22774.1 conserved hypothetical protein [Edwardsiella phage PEi20]